MSVNEEYLGFVEEIGRTIEGDFLYRFDFTYDPDSLWGEFFNIPPACIVPNLEPDINCLSRSAKIISPVRLMTAKNNACFSMQDCIDGIIPLCFSEIDENTIEYDNKPLKFGFGESLAEVEEKIEATPLENIGFEEIKRNDDALVNDLINNLNNNNEEDFDPDEF